MSIERTFDLIINAGTSSPLVINANQNDSGEIWKFNLYQEDGTKVIPVAGEIVGLKSDGHAIVNAGTVNESGQVVITETAQITAAPGANVYEIVFDSVHGTANFILYVEKSPVDDDADFSESDISAIQQAIAMAIDAQTVAALQTGLQNEAQTRFEQDTLLRIGGENEAAIRAAADAVLRQAIDDAAIVPAGSTVVVDNTLSIEGAAADAKATGDAVSDLTVSVSPEREQEYVHFYDVSNSGGTDTTVYTFSALEKGTIIHKIKLKVKTDCVVDLGIVNCEGAATIEKLFSFYLHAGVNLLTLNYRCKNVSAIAITGKNNSIFYGSGETPYRSINTVMVEGEAIYYRSPTLTAGFSVGIYVIPPYTQISEYQVASLDAGNKLATKEEKYNGLNGTNTGHGGTQYSNYVLSTLFKKGSSVLLSIEPYKPCRIYSGIINSKTRNIDYSNYFDLHAGLNYITLPNVSDADYYVFISGDPDSILYGSDSSFLITYSTFNLNKYPETDDVVPNLSFSSSASFGISAVEYSLPLNEAESEYETLYDGSVLNLTGHGGAENRAYLLSPIIKKGASIQLKIKVYSNCNYTFYFVGIYTRKCIYTHTESLSAGLNIIDIDFIPNEDCYLGIDGQAYSIFYGSGSNPILYKQTTIPSLGDTVDTSMTIRADFSVSIYVSNVEEKTGELSDSIIFLAGDSRSSTDYTFYGDLMNAKTGATVLVKGASGRTAAYIASNAYFNELINNQHDFSIWIVGGNDSGASNTVGTFSADSVNGKLGEPVVNETDVNVDYNGTTFIQAIDHIIRKYKKLFYDWKTLNNGHKPRMIMCTDLPQKRSGNVAFSSPENWERKRQAIIEACNKNGMPYLDLFLLCDFDMSYEPEWTSPTDKVTNNGLYFMDGLHPNQYGIDLITSLEIPEMIRFKQILDV